MEKGYNPASDPMNGPNRLALDRSAEAREYDARDWPGSSSFHPPHLEKLFKDMLGASTETAKDVQLEIPFEEE